MQKRTRSRLGQAFDGSRYMTLQELERKAFLISLGVKAT